MNKTKKSGLLKIAGLMAAVTMLTTCVVSGTMAKYTSEGTATGGAVNVAKWSITVGGTDIVTESEVDLSTLSWKIYDADTTQEVDENTVTAKKIAPGTWGYAEIQVQNASDVAALLKVTGATGLTSTYTSAALQSKIIVRESAATSYSGMTTESGDLTTGVSLPKGGNVTIFICYDWAFGTGDNDEDDTKIGNSVTQLTLGTLTITAEQAEPQAKA